MNPLSHTTLRLDLLRDGQKVGLGTGFLIRHESGELWIATAWHVLTGLHPGKHPSEQHLFPEELQFTFHEKNFPNNDGTFRVKLKKVSLRLFNDDGTARWAQHHLGGQYDIAAISLGQPMLGVHHAVNDSGLNSHLAEFPINAGRDIDILGFPEGMDGGNYMPIWKRGAIASEPDIVSPTFMVDAASRKGMSGGPVFARKIGMFPDGPRHAVAGERRKFVGVYVGRVLGDKEETDAQVGRVVKAQYLDEILANPDYPINR